jgi:hypothetical protein
MFLSLKAARLGVPMFVLLFLSTCSVKLLAQTNDTVRVTPDYYVSRSQQADEVRCFVASNEGHLYDINPLQPNWFTPDLVYTWDSVKGFSVGSEWRVSSNQAFPDSTILWHARGSDDNDFKYEIPYWYGAMLT